jgi:hypothetical protein
VFTVWENAAPQTSTEKLEGKEIPFEEMIKE